ncbi:MAG: hypothetical protein AB8W37_11765, partial [Arsenophonus endosymbiont of Dermacentor nuttalli]
LYVIRYTLYVIRYTLYVICYMHNIEKIELLPYHELGKHKWLAMGEKYQLADIKPPSTETMERVKHILQGYGHKVVY